MYLISRKSSSRRRLLLTTKFVVDPQNLASDAIIGRIQREFTRGQPSTIAVTKMKTVTTRQRSTLGTRQRLVDSVFLLIDGDRPFQEKDEHRLRYRLHQYKILCDTWALAGCFVFPSGAPPDDVYCQRAESCAYYELLCDKA